jgi:hypothetical protein
VSVGSSKNHDSGFLRDFHFSTLATSVWKKVFGDIEIPDWLEFRLEVMRDPRILQTLIRVTVELKPHSNFMLELDANANAIAPRRVDIKTGRYWTWEFPVTDMDARTEKDRIPGMFAHWLGEILRSDGYKLYEFDPRIGWRWDKAGDKLPESSLFDPREPFSRTGVPWHPDPAGDLNQRRTTEDPSCSLCGQLHVFSEPPIWAGGNLMWVHRRCWGDAS